MHILLNGDVEGYLFKGQELIDLASPYHQNKLLLPISEKPLQRGIIQDHMVFVNRSLEGH